MSAPTAFSYRKITVTDVARLFEIRALTRENPFSIEALTAEGITERSVTESLGFSHVGYICEASGCGVGFAMANVKTGELWVIAVLPEFEGCGIGRRLLQLTEELLWSAGYASIWLWTGPDRTTRAYRLYTAACWAETDFKENRLFMAKNTPASAESLR